MSGTILVYISERRTGSSEIDIVLQFIYTVQAWGRMALPGQGSRFNSPHLHLLTHKLWIGLKYTLNQTLRIYPCGSGSAALKCVSVRLATSGTNLLLPAAIDGITSRGPERQTALAVDFCTRLLLVISRPGISRLCTRGQHSGGAVLANARPRDDEATGSR